MNFGMKGIEVYGAGKLVVILQLNFSGVSFLMFAMLK